MTGCGATGSLGTPDAPPDTQAVVPSATAQASATPKPGTTQVDRGNGPQHQPTRRPPPIPAYAVKAANKLPLAQQVGQLFLVGFPGQDLSSPVFKEVAAHGWGGLSIAAANAPTSDLYATFSNEAVAQARAATRVPPLMLAQLDGGPQHLGATPKEGRTNAADASLLAQQSGITLAIEPRIDVGVGANARLISQVAPAAVKGWMENNVMTAVAHFPGQGTATQDPIDGPANVGLSAEQLSKRDLIPFRTALGVSPAVTISSAAFTAYNPVNPASTESSIIRGLLRGELRFKGVAMTDDLASVTAVTGTGAAPTAIAAIRAGIDLVYVPEPGLRGEVYRGVLTAVKRGTLTRGRVRDACARVLVLKRRAGLFTP
ncbi:MAG: beta-N-acetylhexosaminidase [Solirubrobacteraceae bacterium]|nr:beta-N-acetylhexosaminidase [Solirubrobacteraceae bacterium]